MFERSEQLLKIACLVLAALLLFQLSRLVTRRNPLAHLTMPALPSLADVSNARTGGKGTNSVPRSQSEKIGTNSAPTQESAKLQTNSALPQGAGKNETNSIVAQESAKAQTNSLAHQGPVNTQTNLVPSPASGMTVRASTPRPEPGRRGPTSGPGAGMAKMGPDAPPAIRARVDRIYQSEVFGPIIRPQPMALFGIAGKNAFLRAPNGQTGLLKEGDELGGVKLLRIGTNRVLIEQEGQQKELTVFSGFGGETLLPSETKNTP